MSTRRDAFRLRSAYAAQHEVTKGFWGAGSVTPSSALEPVGYCTTCGREYVMFGVDPRCCTCGGRQFERYGENAEASTGPDKEQPK